MQHVSLHRLASTAGIAVLLALAACGGGSDGSSQVASLGTLAGDSNTETTIAADSQEAILAYAACMRENGVDMADPTFDADGSTNFGNFGPDSGIDPQSADFQAAQTACGDLIEGIQFGGRGQGGGFDRDAISGAMNDFTACLRDEGLDVDDISFGQPGDGGGAPGGGAPDGSIPAGGGGFNGGPPGTPPDGAATGPGGGGFDPSQIMIERLGLDDSDPAVTAALAVCQPIMDDALQTPTTEG